MFSFDTLRCFKCRSEATSRLMPSAYKGDVDVEVFLRVRAANNDRFDFDSTSGVLWVEKASKKGRLNFLEFEGTVGEPTTGLGFELSRWTCLMKRFLKLRVDLPFFDDLGGFLEVGSEESPSNVDADTSPELEGIE